jgi:hypothetical protein
LYIDKLYVCCKRVSRHTYYIYRKIYYIKNSSVRISNMNIPTINQFSFFWRSIKSVCSYFALCLLSHFFYQTKKYTLYIYFIWYVYIIVVSARERKLIWKHNVSTFFRLKWNKHSEMLFFIFNSEWESLRGWYCFCYFSTLI